MMRFALTNERRAPEPRKTTKKTGNGARVAGRQEKVSLELQSYPASKGCGRSKEKERVTQEKPCIRKKKRIRVPVAELAVQSLIRVTKKKRKQRNRVSWCTRLTATRMGGPSFRRLEAIEDGRQNKETPRTRKKPLPPKWRTGYRGEGEASDELRGAGPPQERALKEAKRKE